MLVGWPSLPVTRPFPFDSLFIARSSGTRAGSMSAVHRAVPFFGVFGWSFRSRSIERWIVYVSFSRSMSGHSRASASPGRKYM